MSQQSASGRMISTPSSAAEKNQQIFLKSNASQLASNTQMCSHPSCSVYDFLPFTCKYCSKSFCQHHQTPEKHKCEHVSDDSAALPQCPLCQQYVNYDRVNGERKDLAVSRHINKGCPQESKLAYTVVKKGSPRSAGKSTSAIYECTFPSCKETTFHPSYCKTCKKAFCTAHRWSDVHECKPPTTHTKPTTTQLSIFDRFRLSVGLPQKAEPKKKKPVKKKKKVSKTNPTKSSKQKRANSSSQSRSQSTVASSQPSNKKRSTSEDHRPPMRRRE